jgi:cysteine desulfurase
MKQRQASAIRLPESGAAAGLGSRTKVYADNAATSLICAEALKGYNEACTVAFGNPSSQHSAGRAAHEALEWSRELYASYMGVKPDTIYFTSCGTESNNIAIRGVLAHMRKAGRTIVVTSSVEHSSIRKTAELAAGPGNFIMVPVDTLGYVNEGRFREILRSNAPKIAMVSIILAQNEVGTLQRIPALVQIKNEVLGDQVPFHTDATQAFGKYMIDPVVLGVDLLTASAHKFHGPRGVGILYARPGLIEPAFTTMTGGGQERGCRSGTENVPAIVASAVALDRMLKDKDVWAERKSRVRAMRDTVVTLLADRIPGVVVNGDPQRGLYNLVSVSLPGGRAADIAKRLDADGIAVGSGSACNKGKPSEAMMAMGRPAELIRGTIRISLSEYNTLLECQIIADAICRAWRSAHVK